MQKIVITLLGKKCAASHTRFGFSFSTFNINDRNVKIFSTCFTCLLFVKYPDTEFLSLLIPRKISSLFIYNLSTVKTYYKSKFHSNIEKCGPSPKRNAATHSKEMKNTLTTILHLSISWKRGQLLFFI